MSSNYFYILVFVLLIVGIASIILLQLRAGRPVRQATWLNFFLGYRKRGKLQRLPKVEAVDFPPAPVHLSYWGIDAKVTLDFEVSVEGKAQDIKVKETSHPEVVRPIMDAVARGKFVPALDACGNTVACRMQLPVSTGKQAARACASDDFAEQPVLQLFPES